jgi:hypothetical protein
MIASQLTASFTVKPTIQTCTQGLWLYAPSRLTEIWHFTAFRQSLHSKLDIQNVLQRFDGLDIHSILKIFFETVTICSFFTLP